MKNLKFLMLCSIVFGSIFMLNSCAKEDFTDSKNLGTTPVDLRYVPVGTPDFPTFPCFSGGIMIDKECDGSYELGWNHTALTENECDCITQEHINIAILNGWCYAVHEVNCVSSNCWKSTDLCGM